jgi:DNA-binding CsgD family transcriptional regulator
MAALQNALPETADGYLFTGIAGLSKAFAAKFRITPREAEVIGCLLDGKTDKEIAAALSIATNTAQTHLKSIYQKTEISGRFALQSLLRG